MTTVGILIGSRKGAFILTSDESRKNWRVSGPNMRGWNIYNVVADTRESARPRLYAAANHFAWGPSVGKRDVSAGDADWDPRSPGLGFAQDMGMTVQNVWCVRPGHGSEPGVVYAGTQPAGLFRSEDWGATWAPVDGLNRHADRPLWTGTGGGDSCVHSIEIDPRDAAHMYASVSSGGSYETHDAGKSWKIHTQSAVPATPHAVEFTKAINEMFPADDLPSDIDPLAVNETHSVRLDRKNPDILWTQTHVGVFRSADAGATWTDVTAGLPSFHGFPIAVTRRAPDAAYVVPLAFADMNDNFRVCDGQFTVYRTKDSGKSWQPLTKGLPGPDDYQSVYRDGMDTDGLDPEGVYVATSNGQVYASIDGGDAWQRLPGTFPPILSLTCATW